MSTIKPIIALTVLSLLFSCKKTTQEGKYASEDSFQLAPPRIMVDSIFFKDSATIKLEFDSPETIIRYSTDGSEIGQESWIYKKPFSVGRTSKLRAKVFHKAYIPSREGTLDIIKIKNNLSETKIKITPDPHPNYIGQGTGTLLDHKKGSLQFRQGSQWLGFQTDAVAIDLKFSEVKEISQITISTLLDQEAWIFSPSKVTILNQDIEVGKLVLSNADKKQIQQLMYIDVPIIANTYSQLKIIVHSLEVIPDWHQGSGTQPWFFIDEILID